MKVAQKQSEEKPDFKEVKARPWERLADHLKRCPQECTMTQFGTHQGMIDELGKRILEFKNCGEKIVINQVGLGMAQRERFTVRGKDMFMKNFSYETFEILNVVRNAGIKPEEFTLYAMDIRNDVLLAVKSTKVLMMDEREKSTGYFKNFFPGFHGEEKDGYTPVRIPEDYRKRIICPKPFSIELDPAPVKAHITFSSIPAVLGNSKYSDNVAKSTREGGYIICLNFDVESAKKFNLQVVPPQATHFSVYHMPGKEKV